MEVYSNDSESLDEADFEASDEEDGNCYISKSCQQTLAKVSSSLHSFLTPITIDMYNFLTVL
jgi:hypothetical protein